MAEQGALSVAQTAHMMMKSVWNCDKELMEELKLDMLWCRMKKTAKILVLLLDCLHPHSFRAVEGPGSSRIFFKLYGSKSRQAHKALLYVCLQQGWAKKTTKKTSLPCWEQDAFWVPSSWQMIQKLPVKSLLPRESLDIETSELAMERCDPKYSTLVKSPHLASGWPTGSNLCGWVFARWRGGTAGEGLR